MPTLLGAAVGEETSTAQLLNILRVLSVRGQNDDLAQIEAWAAKEVDGYEDEDELPGHRVWQLEVRATLHNPMQGVASNVLLPPTILGEKWEEITTYFCRTGVTTIERSLGWTQERGTQGGMLAVEHPHLLQLLQQAEGVIWNCLDAEARFSSAHLLDVVETARARVRSFALECERSGLLIEIGDVLEGEAKNRKEGIWSARGLEIAGKVAVATLVESAKAGVQQIFKGQ